MKTGYRVFITKELGYFELFGTKQLLYNVYIQQYPVQKDSRPVYINSFSTIEEATAVYNRAVNFPNEYFKGRVITSTIISVNSKVELTRKQLHLN